MTDQPMTAEQVLARSIRYHRDEVQRITGQQLVDRIARLGGSLTRQALSKIETEGRGVSIDELLLFAMALDVPPLELLFPVGTHNDRIPAEVMAGGQTMDLWTAARWFSGEAHANDRAGDAWGVRTYLYRQHAALVQEYYEAVLAQPLLPPVTDAAQEEQRRAELQAKLRAQAEAKVRRLRDVRAEMRRHKFIPPPLEEDMRHIDERRHIFMTPEQADAYAAEHPGDLKFVDYSALRAARDYRQYKPGDGDVVRKAQDFARDFEANDDQG